jgi:hypothetical protein
MAFPGNVNDQSRLFDPEASSGSFELHFQANQVGVSGLGGSRGCLVRYSQTVSKSCEIAAGKISVPLSAMGPGKAFGPGRRTFLEL